MNKTINIGNRFLDFFKRTLVKFKDAGFGIKFIKNLSKVADYFNDRNVSLLGKGKVFLSFMATLIYFVFVIDIIPEALFGSIGFLDDAFVIIWMIGNINEELDKYRGLENPSVRYNKKGYKNSHIIDDVRYVVKDEE